MNGGDEFGYVEVDVGLGPVMVGRRSLRRIFTIILVGLVLPDSLVSCVFSFAYFVFHFLKIRDICGVNVDV